MDNNENTNNLAHTFSLHDKNHDKLFIKGLLFVLLASFVYTWVSSPIVTTVTGYSEVGVPADTAIITFTLASSSSDPSLAVATIVDKIDAISDMLVVNWGVRENDIYESQLSVTPTENGYQATTSVGLKSAQVTRVGELVASLYKNGASYVSQPVLSVENIDDYENEVFQEAMKDARANATKISLKNLKLIKKIISIEQSSSESTSTVSSNVEPLEQESSSYSVQSGVIEIQKSVAVTYAMW